MKKIELDKLIIFNSIFEYIDSNMYVVLENNQALIIDPHQNDEIYDLLIQNNIEKVTILLTHEHPDHISGLKWLKDNFDATLISTKETSDYISDIKNTRPILITFVLEEQDKQNGTNFLEKFNQNYEPFTMSADITFDEEFEYEWCNHRLNFKRLQGHSKGSCFIFLDNKYVFTGDTLLKDYPIITRFPRGSMKNYKNVAIPYIKSLDKNLKVFPGHGKMFDLKDLFENEDLNINFR